MPLFRTKPVVVEAMEYPGMRELVDATMVLAWLDENKVNHHHNNGLVIRTVVGHRTASPGDWVVKGINGWFSVCKPEVFEMLFEPIEDK